MNILQELLDDEPMRLLNLAADDGHRTIRADLLIGDRLATLVREHGRALYADYDEEARQLLEKGREQKSPAPPGRGRSELPGRAGGGPTPCSPWDVSASR